MEGVHPILLDANSLSYALKTCNAFPGYKVCILIKDPRRVREFGEAIYTYAINEGFGKDVRVFYNDMTFSIRMVFGNGSVIESYDGSSLYHMILFDESMSVEEADAYMENFVLYEEKDDRDNYIDEFLSEFKIRS